ncbi:MAG: glycine oxidase ThiO [Acidobacteriota bacterium]
MSRPDVLIVGAGVIGLAVARDLASRGLDVVVLDRTRPGAGASWAAAGMLSPHLVRQSGAGQRAFLRLAARSLELHDGLAGALLEESGIDVQRDRDGILEVAPDEERARDLEQRLQIRAAVGLPARWLTAAEVLDLEPGLRPGLYGGAHHLRDGHLDARRLCRALGRSARLAGARTETAAPVARLWLGGGKVRGVVADGERREAGRVVIAAGWRSGELAPPGRPPLPLEPVRGQILTLEEARGRVRRPILSPDGYVVPRPGGRVLAGSTQEAGERDPRPTLAGVAVIAAMAGALVPGLADRPFGTAWAGLRPFTPDGLPILGIDPEHEALIWATGHGANGVLLAPATAEWVAGLVAGTGPPQDPSAFRPDRFTGSSSAGSPGGPVA